MKDEKNMHDFLDLSTLSEEERFELLVAWLIVPDEFPSRNRHFEQYQNAHFQALTRRCRRLKGLVDDLRSAHPCPVLCEQKDDNNWWFYFSFDVIKRQTLLEKEDVDLVLRALEGTPMLAPFTKAWSAAGERADGV